jgi:hypothetical protein
VIVTVSLDGGHEALVIVQTNVFAPTDSAVTPDAESPGVVTVAVPAMTVHTPVPTEGLLPASVAVELHTPKSAPAFAVVGDSSRVMVTVSLEEGHEPFVIVQTNVFAPMDNPVTPEDGDPAVVTVEVPSITVHAPVPTVGVFPASVTVVAHTI